MTRELIDVVVRSGAGRVAGVWPWPKNLRVARVEATDPLHGGASELSNVLV